MKQEIDGEIKQILDEYYRKNPSFNYIEVVQEIFKRKPNISPSEIASIISSLMSNRYGLIHIPDFLLDTFAGISSNILAKNICDPWAGLGTLISKLGDVTKAESLIAITNNQNEFEIGKIIVKNVDWHYGLSINVLDQLPYSYDIVASVLPFGMKHPTVLKVHSADGEIIDLKNDLGYMILVLASLKLHENGVGMFVVPNSFFFSQFSPKHHFDRLGLGVEAVLALPAGTFGAHTNIQTNIILVRRKPVQRTFVAQLSNDIRTNNGILVNYKNQNDTGSIETGRYTNFQNFKGISSLRLEDEIEKTYKLYGVPSVPLDAIAKATVLGRTGKDFKFLKEENAIFIPLIGNSDVVTSQDEFVIKLQNYVQVIVDPSKSDALFVARFLNSELGQNIREAGKTGNFISKLNLQGLKNLLVFIPDINTQKILLEVESAITKEENAISSLQNELSELRQELWRNPANTTKTNEKVQKFSKRFTLLQDHADKSLEGWFETLPFPMSSILRSWQATPSDDFKTKYEHLLHFFEATAEFMSVILLSAFANGGDVFRENKEKLLETLGKQNLGLERATFGTWKTVVEFLGKQTRQMLSGSQDTKEICASMFSDRSYLFPKMIANKEISIILAETNKLRNDWSGHGGVVGQVEAKYRNEQLLSRLSKMRGVFGDGWSEIDLLQCLHCKPRKGMFENELSILTGSNSEFLKENKIMQMWLDVERLYIMNKSSNAALPLLPLIQIGTSPSSAKNACYFFNRLEKDGVRFISYHYIDNPEIKGEFEETSRSIKFLTEISSSI